MKNTSLTTKMMNEEYDHDPINPVRQEEKKGLKSHRTIKNGQQQQCLPRTKRLKSINNNNNHRIDASPSSHVATADQKKKSKPLPDDSHSASDEKKYDNKGHKQHRRRNQRKRPIKHRDHHRPHIFCDLDGVLVDFDGGISNITDGKITRGDDLPVRELWSLVGRHKDFFQDLEWTVDGEQLWKAIKMFQPTLLSGVPKNRTGTVGKQKANWCDRHLKCGKINHIDKAAHKPQRHQCVNSRTFRQGNINLITCWTKYKHHECYVPGSILIDDRIKLKQTWENAGGIFIHHINTNQTLTQLSDLGILRSKRTKKSGREATSRTIATTNSTVSSSSSSLSDNVHQPQNRHRKKQEGDGVSMYKD